MNGSVYRDPRVSAVISRGLRLARADRLDEALSAFTDAIDLSPDDPVAWSHRATCEAKLGMLDAAHDDLERALQLVRLHEAELERRRGNVLIRLGRGEKARAALSTATQLDPRSPDAWYDRGVSLLGSSLSDAADAFKRAIALDPKRADAWANLGHVHARAGDVEAAAEAFNHAVELDPLDTESWFGLGVCLGDSGRYAEALEAWDRVLEVDAKDSDAWNNRGVALHELGRIPEAKAAYRRALSLDPGAVEAASNHALLEPVQVTAPAVPLGLRAAHAPAR